MMSQRYQLLALGALCYALAGCQGQPAVAPDKQPADTLNDAALQPFVASNADFAGYRQVLMTPCEVAFRPDWLRQQNDQRRLLSHRVKEETREALAAHVQAQCQTVLEENLHKPPSYRLVAQLQPDTLVLTPRIINLQVAAPDSQSTVGWSRSFTNESSAMTMVLEATDPESGELLLRFVQPLRSSDTPWLEWSSRVSNRADLQRMLSRWGMLTREQLDQHVSNAKSVAQRQP